MCSPSAGAGLVASPGVRENFTGIPSRRTGPTSGWSSSTTMSRSRVRSEASASSRSSTGSMQQSCSSLNAAHSAFERPAKTSAISAWPSDPGFANWCSRRSGRSTPAQNACQNFGSRAPTLTQPSAHSYGR